MTLSSDLYDIVLCKQSGAGSEPCHDIGGMEGNLQNRRNHHNMKRVNYTKHIIPWFESLSRKRFFTA